METTKSKITLLSLNMTAAAVLLTGMGLAMPRLTEQYGFTLMQQGILVSVQYLGFTIAVLLGGAVSDRYGQEKVMAASLIGVAVAIAFFGSVSTYWMAIIAAVIIGAFGSVLENAITALVMVKENSRRDVHNIIVQIAFSVGAMILPLVYLFSYKVLGSWRIAYYVFALYALVLMFFTRKNLLKKNVEIKKHDDIFAQYKSIVKNPKNFIAPVAMFLYLGAEIGVWMFAPLYFEANGFGVLSAVLSSIFIWFLMTAGRMLTAKAVNDNNIIKILLVFAAVQILILGSLLFVSSSLIAVILISASGFALAPFFPLIMSWMTKMTGNESSSMIAFTMAVGTLGPVIFSTITGIFTQSSGTQYMMVVPTLCFALLFAVLLIFGKTKNA